MTYLLFQLSFRAAASLFLESRYIYKYISVWRFWMLLKDFTCLFDSATIWNLQSCDQRVREPTLFWTLDLWNVRVRKAIYSPTPLKGRAVFSTKRDSTSEKSRNRLRLDLNCLKLCENDNVHISEKGLEMFMQWIITNCQVKFNEWVRFNF